jgi:hypothetical protein
MEPLQDPDCVVGITAHIVVAVEERARVDDDLQQRLVYGRSFVYPLVSS